MGLSESSAKRRDDAFGKDIKTYVDPDTGSHIQATVLDDADGAQLGISDNPLHIQAETLTAIQTAAEIIDNFISGNRGLVTEDNSASVLTQLESLLAELGLKADLTDTQPISGTVTVQDGGGSLTVDGTVTVQDGGSSLTVDGTVAANMQDGGGTALTSTTVSSDRALDVNVVRSVSGVGGTSMTDDNAFTTNTDAMTPIGAMFDDASPDSVDEGDAGVVRMSTNRNLYVTLRDAAGNERGLNIDANGALAAAQTIHDYLNLNANLQVSDVDVGSNNPVPVSDAGGSLTIDQATHDNLNCNANLQVGDADAATDNPVPVEEQETVPTDAARNNPSYSLSYTSGDLTQIDAVVGGTTYRKTLSYTSGDVTAVSAWSVI